MVYSVSWIAISSSDARESMKPRFPVGISWLKRRKASCQDVSDWYFNARTYHTFFGVGDFLACGKKLAQGGAHGGCVRSSANLRFTQYEDYNNGLEI